MMNTLGWKIEDEIGHLVLSQPPANRMSVAFFEELAGFTLDVLPGSGIRALVIYPRGRHFSAGADPQELKAYLRENLPDNFPRELPGFLSDNTKSFSIIQQLAIPTFAAIRGVCLGSALELALCCKFRICAEGSVLGFPESTFGLMPGCGGSVKLPAIVGRAKAMELILTGGNFSAEEACRWGIVHKIAPRKLVLEETMAMAKRILAQNRRW